MARFPGDIPGVYKKVGTEEGPLNTWCRAAGRAAGWPSGPSQGSLLLVSSQLCCTGLKVPVSTILIPCRRSKLKVLDFTHDFEHSNWEECSETTPAPFVITHMLEEPEADPLAPSSKEQSPHNREPVEIHTDLFLGGLFGFFHLSGFPSYILQRVEKSHGCLRLRCRTLVINQVPLRSLVEILGMLELETIREVRLHHRSRFCFRSDLIQFFTHVGQMSNLGHLIMNDIPWDFPADCFSLLSPLGHLQKLHLIFGCLSGQLQKMLR